ncbi:hypothetical protein [Shewanella putrefaciens]|uniref:hypothetical protein n=1 Tax=Shewanella putrefaciens TaxID=24 RepID=UPI0018E712EE|nr:hypothetical protein [Shewanella putrefaciens]
MASIRNEILNGIEHACEQAEKLTGHSVNRLPEYFLSVKVMDYLHAAFESFTYSMEEHLDRICEDAGYDVSDVPEEYRISNLTRADLVIQSKKSFRDRHIIEFKRSVSFKSLKKDVLRLAWMCAQAPDGHKLEKNFLAVVAHRDINHFDTRNGEIEALVTEHFPDVKVKYSSNTLPEYKSTHPKKYGAPLCSAVWEFTR